MAMAMDRIWVSLGATRPQSSAAGWEMEFTYLPPPWIEAERLRVLKGIVVGLPRVDVDLPPSRNSKPLYLQVLGRLPQNSINYGRQSHGLVDHLQRSAPPNQLQQAFRADLKSKMGNG